MAYIDKINYKGTEYDLQDTNLKQDLNESGLLENITPTTLEGVITADGSVLGTGSNCHTADISLSKNDVIIINAYNWSGHCILAQSINSTYIPIIQCTVSGQQTVEYTATNDMNVSFSYQSNKPMSVKVVRKLNAKITTLKNAFDEFNDVNLLESATWVQGSFVPIDAYNAQTNSTDTRIRTEIPINNEGVFIKVVDDDYQYICAVFNEDGELIGSSTTWGSNDYSLLDTSGTLLRVALKHTDDSSIKYVEGYKMPVLVLNGKPITVTEIKQKINALNYYGRPVDEFAVWLQGGYGAIGNYSSPNANSGDTRIKTEFNITADDCPCVIKRTNSGFDFTYAVFDNEGNTIEYNGAWQSKDVYLPYDNINTVRLCVRRSDNSSITPQYASSSGINLIYSGNASNIITKLKVMTYNIGRFSYGIEPYYLNNDYENKLANYKRFFAEQRCDVIGLQECNQYLDGATSGSVLANSAIFDYLYPYHLDEANFTNIKSKYPIESPTIASLSTGRLYCSANIKINNKSIFLLDVHTTPNEGTAQDEARASEIAEIIELVADKEYFIIFGDFNAPTTDLYQSFIDSGFNLANGGYLPYEWTYSGDPSDYSSDTPSALVRYFDNIITSSNIIVDYSERLNVYSDLSSDHIPFVAYLTIK